MTEPTHSEGSGLTPIYMNKRLKVMGTNGLAYFVPPSKTKNKKGFNFDEGPAA
jgi:hypothetical protein